jgi:predicted XRE-type DNA-binding protein
MVQTLSKSDGNAFADLGDGEELLAKSKLVAILQDIIEARELTQAEAARLMGIDDSAAYLILRGRLKDFSIARLVTLIQTLVRAPT